MKRQRLDRYLLGYELDALDLAEFERQAMAWMVDYRYKTYRRMPKDKFVALIELAFGFNGRAVHSISEIVAILGYKHPAPVREFLQRRVSWWLRHFIEESGWKLREEIELT